MDLKLHLQSFLQGSNKVKRCKSAARDKDTDNDCSDSDRRERATTPGRTLLEEVKLKPPSERTFKNRLEAPPKEQKAELKSHFRDFMRTPASVKRGRSFSQPRDKDKGSGKEESSLSRKESFNEKYTREQDQVKIELENHTKRFLQRKSMIRPIRNSDNDSDNDSLSVNLSSNKTLDKDSRDSSSEDDVENSENSACNNIVSRKPPPLSAPLHKSSDPFKDWSEQITSDKLLDKSKRSKSPSDSHEKLADKVALPDEYVPIARASTNNILSSSSSCDETPAGGKPASRYCNTNKIRPERLRSKSDIVPPTSYDIELDVEQMLEECWGTPAAFASASNGRQQQIAVNTRTDKNEDTRLEAVNGHSEPQEKENEENDLCGRSGSEVRSVVSCEEESEERRERRERQLERQSELLDRQERPRIRRNNVYSNNEYVVLDSKTKIGNSNPRPFSLSPQTSVDNDNNSFSRQNSVDYQDKTNFSRQNSVDYQDSRTFSRQSSVDYCGGVAAARQAEPDCGDRRYSQETVSLRPTESGAVQHRVARQQSHQDKENKKNSKEKFKLDRRRSESKADDAGDNSQTSSFTSRTTEILNACKNDLKRLTYRKTYSRTRSDKDLDKKIKAVEKAEIGNAGDTASGAAGSKKATVATQYTQLSTGHRIPNRPTTPGPYFGMERAVTPGPAYSSKRPTTPGPFTRESWKRTNQKFNYGKHSKYGNHETFV